MSLVWASRWCFFASHAPYFRVSVFPLITRMTNLRSSVKEDSLVGCGSDVSLGLGNRLPLNLSVLKRYVYFRQQNVSKSVRELFQVILVELKVIWEKAALPLKNDKKKLDYLVKLYDYWVSVKKLLLLQRRKLLFLLVPEVMKHFCLISNNCAIYLLTTVTNSCDHHVLLIGKRIGNFC